MEALPVSPLTRDTLEERVYAQTRDALMEGRFAAGQPITLGAGAVVPIGIEKSLHEHFVPKDPKHPHRLVVAALRARDGKAAKRALVCDIAWAADVIMKHLV
jgi:DNA-binding GntR family transcriptional regulator